MTAKRGALISAFQMSSDCPLSPQKKALEEQNAVAPSTDARSPDPSSVAAAKRPRRISLETFFQPAKAKRPKEDENCTPSESKAGDDASAGDEATAADRRARTVADDDPDAAADSDPRAPIADRAGSEESDGDLMIVDERPTPASRAEQPTSDELRSTTPARRRASTRSPATASNGSASPTAALSDAEQKATPASGRRRLTPAEKLAREQAKVAHCWLLCSERVRGV